MNSKDFKNTFGMEAKLNGFSRAFGGWFKESHECIIILELQKSNFGNYYLLNIKMFIQGAFGRVYSPNKDLIKSSIGHITVNETQEYKDVLDLDNLMSDNNRVERLKVLFEERINPLVDKTLTKIGIKELASKGELSLLATVKAELGI